MKTLEERFWKYAKKTDDCWLWTGAPTEEGYGYLRIRNKAIYAHRLSWQLFRGPIPAGLCVLHSCDNPPCTNPDHLFLGTRKDNARDMRNKGRHPDQYGEKSSRAKLTIAQVIELRNLRESGMSYRKLGKMFGIAAPNAWRIVKREHWKTI
jgi:hypothetical protein